MTQRDGSITQAGRGVLGRLIDRTSDVSAEGLATLVAEEAATLGLDDTTIYLQDYEQKYLLPLPVPGRRGVIAQRVDAGPAGEAFASAVLVEEPLGENRRVWVPLLDGSDRVGVIGVTVQPSSPPDPTLLRQLAKLVADMLLVKGPYSDFFFLARRREPMSLAAEMQWQLLPPLTMTTPSVAVSGMLSPAYDVGGDSFDYALNGDILHLMILDAMGHGLRAAILASSVVGAYRHARRAGVGLRDKYALMDDVIRNQFSDEHFVTAHMADLNVRSGVLRWVNAGHPAPLLIRDGKVVRELRTRTTLPIGLGGERPQIAEEQLEPGDRVCLFTDGIVEERSGGDVQFGVPRLVQFLERAETLRLPLSETVRTLSRELLEARGGRTSDDATTLMVEWRQPLA